MGSNFAVCTMPQRLTRAVAVVVDRHDLVARFKQGKDGVAADIAGSTGDQYGGLRAAKPEAAAIGAPGSFEFCTGELRGSRSGTRERFGFKP